MRYIFILGVLVGIWVGWYGAITFVISVIDRREGVMTVEDWSRMRELRGQLETSKILFF